MRVQVNLASRPFVELRPFFLRLRLLMLALALVAAALAFSAHVLGLRAARQQAELDRLRDQTIALQRARLQTEQRLRQPVNAQVLERAHFLNTLFLRKSFSWTAVMMDLENVLPSGVQVTSLEPAVATDGDVVIRLRVAGERDRAVQLVRNLERSQRFLDPRLGSESAQAKESGTANAARPGLGGPAAPAGPPPGVEFEILANYNPLPAGQPYNVNRAKLVPAEEFGTGTPAPARHHVPAAGLSPARNARNGYTRNGVVLPPYIGSGPGAAAQPGVPR